MVNKVWTEEADESLRKMVSAGEMFEYCAKVLGVSRNAAIGRAYRLGLKGVRHVVKPRKTMSRKVFRSLSREQAPVLFAKGPVFQPMARKAPYKAVEHELPGGLENATTLLELRAGQCRYPVLVLDSALDTKFCPNPAVPESSWCEFHRKIVVIPRKDVGKKQVSESEYIPSRKRFYA